MPTPETGYQRYSFVADLYDHVGPYRDRSDLDFWVESALESGGPVLELGCGTGRVLLPVARAGVEVVGLDLSPHMLTVCRRRLDEEEGDVRRRVELVEGDMRDFDLGRRFALVTIPFRAFQHLYTVEDQLACLAAVRRHLEPAGRLILDVFNPSLDALVNRPVGEEIGDEGEWTTPDGRRVVRRHRVVARDPLTQVSHFELIYYVTHPDGREERLVDAFSMRHLFRFEAEHLLARAGFEVEALYSDYEGSPYGAKDPGELVFVARPARS